MGIWVISVPQFLGSWASGELSSCATTESLHLRTWKRTISGKVSGQMITSLPDLTSGISKPVSLSKHVCEVSHYFRGLVTVHPDAPKPVNPRFAPRAFPWFSRHFRGFRNFREFSTQLLACSCLSCLWGVLSFSWFQSFLWKAARMQTNVRRAPDYSSNLCPPKSELAGSGPIPKNQI